MEAAERRRTKATSISTSVVYGSLIIALAMTTIQGKSKSSGLQRERMVNAQEHMRERVGTS